MQILNLPFFALPMTAVVEGLLYSYVFLHGLLDPLAQFAGLDGVVSSPQEAKMIRDECGKDFLIITPGIRPIGSDIDDQTRISLPKYAIENGSNYLVVGRPIRSAENPKLAAQNILEEIKGV